MFRGLSAVLQALCQPSPAAHARVPGGVAQVEGSVWIVQHASQRAQGSVDSITSQGRPLYGRASGLHLTGSLHLLQWRGTASTKRWETRKAPGAPASSQVCFKRSCQVVTLACSVPTNRHVSLRTLPAHCRRYCASITCLVRLEEGMQGIRTWHGVARHGMAQHGMAWHGMHMHATTAVQARHDVGRLAAPGLAWVGL